MNYIELEERSPPLDPAILAENAALQVFHQPDVLERNLDVSERLIRLDQAAAAFRLTGQSYWVETSRALSIPYEFERDDEVKILNFFGLNFEGTFACYSKVMVGQILGRTGVNSVSALCLTFSETTLLPYMETIPDQHLLHVPVMAVNSIDRTSRAA